MAADHQLKAIKDLAMFDCCDLVVGFYQNTSDKNLHSLSKRLQNESVFKLYALLTIFKYL